MAKYHLGEEIKKEVMLQGMTMEVFADKIFIQRQSVYDVFKNDYMATDKLAHICRVLGRDFFRELSLANNPEVKEVVEGEETIEAPMSRLLPKDELHVVSNGEAIDAVVGEYMTAERNKPLVVFYAADTEFEVDYMLGRWERKGWKGETGTARDIHRDTMFQEWGDGMRIDQTPHYTMLIYTGDIYTRAIANAVELMETSGRHIVLVCPVVNSLSRGKRSGLIYDDVAEGCFRVWSDKAHFVVVQDKESKYLQLREYYHAYMGDGIIDRLVSTIALNGDMERRLLDLTAGTGQLTVSETKPADETGLSRIELSLPLPDDAEKKLLFHNGINNEPHLKMWIDIRYGYIADYQYRVHPLTVPTGSISLERLERKSKPKSVEEKPKEWPPRVLIPEVTPGTEEYKTVFAEVMEALNTLNPNNHGFDSFGDDVEEINGLSASDADIFNVDVSRERVVMSHEFMSRDAVESCENYRLTITGMESVAKLIIFFRLDYHCGDDLPYELCDAIIEYFIEKRYDRLEQFEPILKSLNIKFEIIDNYD